MKFTVKLTSKADEDLIQFEKVGNTQALKKINSLLDELELHPKTGTGHPEQLKGHNGTR